MVGSPITFLQLGAYVSIVSRSERNLSDAKRRIESEAKGHTVRARL